MGELKEIEKEEPDKENPDNNKPDAGTKNPDKNNQASKSDNVNKAAKTGDNNPVAERDRANGCVPYLKFGICICCTCGLADSGVEEYFIYASCIKFT